ncbi:hypothetical protein RDABS01_031367 [Bienertia sinuspersici]
MAWMEMFPHLTVHHLPLDKSDHRPIKIASMTTFNSRRRKVKRFRFEDFWLSSPKCEDIVRGAWGQLHGEGAEGDVPEKIKRVSAALVRWNREDDTHEWKEDMVRGLFLEFEADMMCNIPLSSMDTNDCLVWHYSKNGAYSMKTGYHFYKGEPSTLTADKIWNKIWKLRIPPKVKTFVWRLCNNAIPTAKGLHTRIEGIDPWCGRCRVEEEDEFHAIWSCRFAKIMWDLVDVEELKYRFRRGKIIDWVGCVLDVVRGDEVGKYFAIAWAIWNQRNIIVHGGTECCPEEVVARTDHIMEAFENAWREGCEHGGVGHGEGRKENVAMERLEVAWTTPTEGVFKVNVDGATFGEHGVGMGAILRDSQGNVVRAACTQLKQSFEVNIVEAKSLILGLHLASHSDVERVQVESDCKQVIDMINNNVIVRSYMEIFVKEILEEANNAAHVLAHIRPMSYSTRIWVEDYPVELDDVIATDICLS